MANEPMTDERRAEIRAMDWGGMRTYEVVDELLAEVGRLRDMLAIYAKALQKCADDNDRLEADAKTGEP